MQHRPGKLHRDDLLEPPKIWTELQMHSQKESFIQVAKKEYYNLFQHNTFKKVERPMNVQVLQVCWVFVYKFDIDGYLKKHKLQLYI